MPEMQRYKAVRWFDLPCAAADAKPARRAKGGAGEDERRAAHRLAEATRAGRRRRRDGDRRIVSMRLDMGKKKRASKREWVDPDDAPKPLDDSFPVGPHAAVLLGLAS